MGSFVAYPPNALSVCLPEAYTASPALPYMHHLWLQRQHAQWILNGPVLFDPEPVNMQHVANILLLSHLQSMAHALHQATLQAKAILAALNCKLI